MDSTGEGPRQRGLLGPSASLQPLLGANLSDLIQELKHRVDDIEGDQQRLRLLLDAVVLLSMDPTLEGVLQRIVAVACDLSQARYAALGVLGSTADGRLQQFVTHGMTDEQRAAIGDLPRGRGLLGEIIDKPTPLRLRDIAKHPSSYGFPEGHPPMRSFLGMPIRLRDRVFGNLYVTEKAGGEDFTERDEAVLVALAAAAGVVIENAQLYEEGMRRQNWLEATAEITRLLSSWADVERALQVVADRARALAEADVATIALRRSEEELEVSVVSGAPSSSLPSGPLPMSQTLVGQVMRTGETMVVHDVGQDGRPSLATKNLEGWPTLGPALLLPLRTGEGVEGVLSLVWAVGRDAAFHAVDVALPLQFAEQAALAIQVARARADKEKLVVLEDRDRIGRDLHDLVIQRLFAVGLSLESTARQLGDLPEVAGRLASAVDDLDDTIKDIRRSIFALGSTADSTDIRASTLEATERAARALKFRPEVRFVGPVNSVVTPGLAEQVLAVLGEALSNMVKHANAAHASVELKVGDDVELIVSDDGEGLPSDATESGLRNIRERAERLGGRCHIESAPGSGTTIVWSVPPR